jgi:zinc/manganese transport system substrate-binding protein
MIQRQAANPKIQVNQPGYFQAADYVTLTERPAQLDRSAGDVHSMGNPHIHTDPRNIGLVAKALTERMAQLDPPNAATYAARYQDFSARWQMAIERWQQEGASLKGVAIVVHHKSWAYLENWLGLQEVAALEPKPGLPPSGVHLAQVLAQLKVQPAKAVVRAAYQDSRPSDWLAERAGIPAVVLPFTVGGTPEAKDLFGLFDDTIQKLLGAVKQ